MVAIARVRKTVCNSQETRRESASRYVLWRANLRQRHRIHQIRPRVATSGVLKVEWKSLKRGENDHLDRFSRRTTVGQQGRIQCGERPGAWAAVPSGARTSTWKPKQFDTTIRAAARNRRRGKHFESSFGRVWEAILHHFAQPTPQEIRRGASAQGCGFPDCVLKSESDTGVTRITNENL